MAGLTTLASDGQAPARSENGKSDLLNIFTMSSLFRAENIFG
jgi:hypothetical protein